MFVLIGRYSSFFPRVVAASRLAAMCDAKDKLRSTSNYTIKMQKPQCFHYILF